MRSVDLTATTQITDAAIGRFGQQSLGVGLPGITDAADVRALSSAPKAFSPITPCTAPSRISGTKRGKEISLPADSCQAPIEIRNLIKNFGPVRALDGLDLTVCKGEVHGFLGPNGAGKSTPSAHSVGVGEGRQRKRSVIRRRPVVGRCQTTSSDRLRARRCHLLAVTDRRRNHRFAGPLAALDRPENVERSYSISNRSRAFPASATSALGRCCGC